MKPKTSSSNQKRSSSHLKSKPPSRSHIHQQWHLIVLASATEFGTQPRAVLRKWRGARAVNARHVAIYIIRNAYPETHLRDIAAFFNRSRTSMSEAYSRVEHKLSDRSFQKNVGRVETKVKETL